MTKFATTQLRLSITALLSIAFVGCSSNDAPSVELTLDEAQLNAVYEAAENMTTEQIIADAQSMEVAAWLFSENCSSCHQADATGRMGVPDLTDTVWLFEGTEASVKHTISQGRTGVMPEFGGAIGEVELGLLVTYVQSFSEDKELGSNEIAGQAIYEEHCVACHAADGSGIANLGPNLADDYWQWGGNMITIRQSITTGRTAECPAQQDILSDAQIQLLTAYTLSLSQS